MDWNTVIGVAAAFAGFAVVRGIREAFRNKSNKPAQEQFADVNQQYSLINDESINANNAAEDAKSNGIGGWLILVAIGIISDPIVSLFFGGCKIVCVNGHSGVPKDPTLKKELIWPLKKNCWTVCLPTIIARNPKN